MVPTICHSVWNECKELWSGEKWFSLIFFDILLTQLKRCSESSGYAICNDTHHFDVCWKEGGVVRYGALGLQYTQKKTQTVAHPASSIQRAFPCHVLHGFGCISIWHWRRSWQCRMGNLHQRAPIFMNFDSVFLPIDYVLLPTNEWWWNIKIFPDRPWRPHVCAYCKWTKVTHWNVLEHVAVWFCGNMLPHGSSCYLPGQFSQAAHWPPFPSTCWTRFLRISRRFRRCNRPTPNSARWRTQGQPGPTCGGAEVWCEDKLKQKKG